MAPSASSGDSPPSLSALGDKALKGLNYANRNINVITGLLILNAALLFAAVLFPRKAAAVLGISTLSSEEGMAMWALLAAFTLLLVASIIGILMRTRWGRVMAFICCGFALINIPLGTIVGVLGIVYFAKGGALFGPTRITSSQLKLELASRTGK